MRRIVIPARHVDFPAVDSRGHAEHVPDRHPRPPRSGQLADDRLDGPRQVEQTPQLQDPGHRRGEGLGHRHQEVPVARLHPRVPLEHDRAAQHLASVTPGGLPCWLIALPQVRTP